MIQGRDFIFTGLQSWDLPIGSNARDIAREVSRHNRVLYLNPPEVVMGSSESEAVREAAGSGKAQRRGGLRDLGKNLWVADMPFTLWPVNRLPEGWWFDRVNRINNRRIFRFAREMARTLGFERPIHFIDNDVYRSFYAKEFLNPALSIYYSRDYLLGVDYWKRHGARLEPLLMEKCDLVTCNSTYLASRAKAYNPHSFFIGQGVDLTGYEVMPDAVPADMAEIPRPIVGYMGYITARRLDVDLLYEVAVQNPALSFVLVGGEDNVFSSHPLHALANVFFLGKKDPEEVPAYINAFDICINPQRVNEITLGNYPRKIDEYLGLGKPTVATRTPAMEMFSDYVFLCRSAGEYQQAFRRILAAEAGPSAEERIRFARSHTWEASVNELYTVIETFLNDERGAEK